MLNVTYDEQVGVTDVAWTRGREHGLTYWVVPDRYRRRVESDSRDFDALMESWGLKFVCRRPDLMPGAAMYARPLTAWLLRQARSVWAFYWDRMFRPLWLHGVFDLDDDMRYGALRVWLRFRPWRWRKRIEDVFNAD